MPVPDYQSLMLPVLQAVSDGKVHKVAEIHEAVAQSQSLSDDDLNELLPSGKQTTFVNRATWAMTYMKQAGLLERPKRAHYEIPSAGGMPSRQDSTASPSSTSASTPSSWSSRTGRIRRRPARPRSTVRLSQT